MQTIPIRSVAEDDLPDRLDMIRGLAAHHGDTATLTAEGVRAQVLGPRAWMPTLIARREGVPLGYATLHRIGQLQYWVRGMELHHLFVAEPARGTGVGRALVAAARTRARRAGAGYLSVGTDAQNSAAQAFYQAVGFAPRPDRGPRYSVRL